MAWHKACSNPIIMEAKRIETFDDWKELFQAWQKDIGYDARLFSSLLHGYEFVERFAGLITSEIKFGEFAGGHKWENPGEIPRSEIQDLLLRLITVQGDTEFASVEQQRRLLDSAPTGGDLHSMVRINAEEMRHGWQMAYLLVRYFGDAGKTEARRLLERRADKKERLLGAFNEPLDHWLDFFAYTSFVDRDGMYQLKMLGHSGFAPLGRSIGPMLSEESFHFLTGTAGLQRILRAGKVPVEIIQKVLNRWLPICFDLFGHERSQSAAKVYHWGLKGRLNEELDGPVGNPEILNESARKLFRKEIEALVESLNKEIREGRSKLYVPDLRFNRSIGIFQGQPFSVTGERLDRKSYAQHLESVLPTIADRKRLREMTKEPGWIAPLIS